MKIKVIKRDDRETTLCCIIGKTTYYCVIKNKGLKRKKRKNFIDYEFIRRYLVNSENEYLVIDAIKTCKGRNDIPLDIIERGIKHKSKAIRMESWGAFAEKKDIPLELVELGLKEDSAITRRLVWKACKGRTDIPTEWIKT